MLVNIFIFLKSDVLTKYYPFYIKDELISQPYHQIHISNKQKRQEFIDICDKFMLPCIPSTNYAVLDNAPEKYKKFNDELFNLSSIIKSEKQINQIKMIADIVNMLDGE